MSKNLYIISGCNGANIDNGYFPLLYETLK